jgi:hypothetical protein
MVVNHRVHAAKEPMVRRMRGTSTVAAVIAAVALLAQALPAAAQSGGSYAQACRYFHGRLVCSGPARPGGAVGSHVYERWSDGSPAIGDSASPDTHRFPQYLGGHNAWYGFGR